MKSQHPTAELHVHISEWLVSPIDPVLWGEGLWCDDAAGFPGHNNWVSTRADQRRCPAPSRNAPARSPVGVPSSATKLPRR